MEGAQVHSPPVLVPPQPVEDSPAQTEQPLHNPRYIDALQIRSEQMLVLDEVRSPEFEDYMLRHMREFSPLHSDSLGEAGMRTLIQTGMERAKAHRFTHRGAVRFYIETMILLGVDFDTDPQYAGAGKILRGTQAADEMQRADALHDWLMPLVDTVAGHNREHARRALERARKLPFQPIPLSRPDFQQAAIARMNKNHPEKAAYIGEAALAGLIPRALEEARRYNVATDAGVCLFLGLMYAVGHGVAHDPKYPWIAQTLTNPAIPDATKRVDRLYSKTMTYLDHVLEHLARRA